MLNGFFVSYITRPGIASLRLKLGETRAYPRNAGVTIEYQIRPDPSTYSELRVGYTASLSNC